MFSHAELRVELLAQRHVFHLQVLPPQRPRDPHLQLVDLQPPLGDVIVGPVLHRIDGQLLRPVSRHEDADRRLGERLGPRDQLHPVLAGQPEIRQQHVEVLLLQQLRRRLGVLGQIDVVTILERRAQTFPRRLLIIHYQ